MPKYKKPVLLKMCLEMYSRTIGVLKTTQNFVSIEIAHFFSFKYVTTHSMGFNEKSFGRIWKDLKNLRNAEVQKQLYWVLHWYVRCFYFLSDFPLQKVNLKPHALCIDRNCSLLDKVPPIVLSSKNVYWNLDIVNFDIVNFAI